MPSLVVEDRHGRTTELHPATDRSLMHVLRDAGYDEILALCGGQRSCATCHVYVDAEHFAELPAMSGEEDDLLDISEHRRPTSRLSCQLTFMPSLDGMKVTIAPED